MTAFVDQHRERLGVEPICKALQVAPSAYWREAARRRDPALRPPRRQRDAMLVPEIERVWNGNLRVYGADRCGSNCVASTSRWRAARSSG
jgi:putative transposase